MVMSHPNTGIDNLSKIGLAEHIVFMIMLPTPQKSVLPPLENGDRLNRFEFESRYQAMAEERKAELIEGRVYMASPLRAQGHGKPHARIMTWLGTYEAGTVGVEVLDNATVRLDVDNEPQPDALLRIETGGQTTISADDYVEGAPELIVEIAASSVALDLHDKQQVYRRNGVQEYLVWQVYEQQIRWFHLQQGDYVERPRDEQGVIRSLVFPGLWLAAEDLLAGRIQEVLKILQQGMELRDSEDLMDERVSQDHGASDLFNP